MTSTQFVVSTFTFFCFKSRTHPMPPEFLFESWQLQISPSRTLALRLKPSIQSAVCGPMRTLLMSPWPQQMTSRWRHTRSFSAPAVPSSEISCWRILTRAPSSTWETCRVPNYSRYWYIERKQQIKSLGFAVHLSRWVRYSRGPTPLLPWGWQAAQVLLGSFEHFQVSFSNLWGVFK